MSCCLWQWGSSIRVESPLEKKGEALRINAFFSGIGRFVSKLFFPDICIFCLKYSKKYICAACRGKLMLSSGNASENSVYKYGNLYCYGKYVGLLRERFISYKFKKEMWLGVHFGYLMYEAFKKRLEVEHHDMVTYVPISDKRFCERGYNQSREMAKAIAKELKIPCVDMFECVKNNVGMSQSKLGRSKRLTHVHGRFGLKKKCVSVAGKKLLLVDDIFTTGSTLNECAALLSERGAFSIDGMVFATGRADLE